MIKPELADLYRNNGTPVLKAFPLYLLENSYSLKEPQLWLSMIFPDIWTHLPAFAALYINPLSLSTSCLHIIILHEW